MDHWCFLAVSERGYTSFFFEKADKVVRVLYADHLTDVHNLFIGIQKQVFCLVNPDLIQVLYGRVFIIFRKFTT